MTACLLCRGDLDGAVIVATHARYGVACERVCCAACGLCQQTARPSAAELAHYYATAYRVEHPALPRGDALPGTPEHEASLDRDAAARVANIQDLVLDGTIPARCRILEVGCGDGRTAAALMRAGFTVVAIEADPGMAEQARERGVEVVDLAGVPLWPEGCALICSFHVLEHVSDPLTTLRLWSALASTLLIEVPNVAGPYGPRPASSWFFQRPHIVDFSTRTLGASLMASGWIDVKVYTCPSVLVGIAKAPRRFEEYSPPSIAEACEAAGANAEHASETIAALRAWDAGPPMAKRDDDLRTVPTRHDLDADGGDLLAAAIGAAKEEHAVNDGARLLAVGADVHQGESVGAARDIGQWLDASGSDGLDWLRAEIVAMDNVIAVALYSLGRVCEDLDKQALADAEAWSADSWLWGYACGQARRSQSLNVALSQIANGLVARALPSKGDA